MVSEGKNGAEEWVNPLVAVEDFFYPFFPSRFIKPIMLGGVWHL